MNMKVPMDTRVPQIYRDAQFRVDKSCVKTPLPTLPRCVITYRHLFSRIQMKTFHENCHRDPVSVLMTYRQYYPLPPAPTSERERTRYLWDRDHTSRILECCSTARVDSVNTDGQGGCIHLHQHCRQGCPEGTSSQHHRYSGTWAATAIITSHI